MATSTSEPATESGRAAGVAYERAGSGPPLLLIHGLGGTRGIWRPQLPYLVAGLPVMVGARFGSALTSMEKAGRAAEA